MCFPTNSLFRRCEFVPVVLIMATAFCERHHVIFIFNQTFCFLYDFFFPGISFAFMSIDNHL